MKYGLSEQQLAEIVDILKRYSEVEELFYLDPGQ